MALYRVSRVYATRMEWTVEAETAKEALRAMDDSGLTPTDAADEEWLGPVEGLTEYERQDMCKRVKEDTHGL